MKLIAIVSVMTLVAGVRTEIPPGEEVTGLHPVDVEELKRIGSIVDEDEELAKQKAADKAERAAGREFANARKALQAADESIAP